MITKKILIFVTRYLCYASNESFAMELERNFNALGFEAEICNIINNDLSDIELTKYIGKKYLAIIDFNSTLQRALVGDERFLDLIDGPFYDYIVDHPLYHHPVLKIELKNYNVICIDKDHKKYIEKYYPHIKKVIFQPLMGSRATSQISFRDKRNCMLFSGTYYPPEKYKDLIDDKKEQKLLWQLVDIMLSDVNLTPEMALEIAMPIVKEYGHNEYRDLLNCIYPSDIYVRAVNRSKCIAEAIKLASKSDTELIICGNDWEKYPGIEELNIKVINGMDYMRNVELIASSRMILNILPGFRNGTHDRIFTAMQNASVAVSDSNNYIEETIGHEAILTYDINNLESSFEQLLSNIMDENKMASISECGQNLTKEKYSWRSLAENIISCLTDR